MCDFTKQPMNLKSICQKCQSEGRHKNAEYFKDLAAQKIYENIIDFITEHASELECDYFILKEKEILLPLILQKLLNANFKVIQDMITVYSNPDYKPCIKIHISWK